MRSVTGTTVDIQSHQLQYSCRHPVLLHGKATGITSYRYFVVRVDDHHTNASCSLVPGTQESVCIDALCFRRARSWYSVVGFIHDTLAQSTSLCLLPQGEAAQQSARAFCAAATAPTQQADGPASMKKPDWAPGTPASGREQTLGEAFAAMQYHGRGARKVHTAANLACLALRRHDCHGSCNLYIPLGSLSATMSSILYEYTVPIDYNITQHFLRVHMYSYLYAPLIRIIRDLLLCCLPISVVRVRRGSLPAQPALMWSPRQKPTEGRVLLC